MGSRVWGLVAGTEGKSFDIFEYDGLDELEYIWGEREGSAVAEDNA